MSENSNMSKEKTITKESINNLKKTIQDLYLADDIPWVLGYSGGKDSTATLQLVWIALAELETSELNKTVHVINTDTLVESPIMSNWAKHSLEIMKNKAKDQGLPIATHILKPEWNNTFWVNFLGRGYPFPRKKFRWCTDRLKIQPVNNFVKNKIAEHGEIIMVLGTRKAESTNRAHTMEKYEKRRVRELLSPNPSLVNELVFSPLENWSDSDVWVFLMQYKNPWGYSNQDLLTLYRGASADTECPLMVQKDLPSCGKSRFGCWVCTMVEKDKSMEAMIANDDEKSWMMPLLEFRNEFGDELHDRERRGFRKMNGSLTGSYERLHHGPYLKEYRESWLRRLLEIQKEINDNGPEEFSELELITMEELKQIRKIWTVDKHEFDDAVPQIYEEVMEKKYVDTSWIVPETFSLEEWNILKEVCLEYNSEETLLFEMAYSLIDVENRSNGLNNRKGILDNLEKCIKTSCYKNEDDALEFYKVQMERKKNFGGQYNEKFLTPSNVLKEPDTIYNVEHDIDETLDIIDDDEV